MLPALIIMQHALITSSYIDFYNSLQYTFFSFSNNFFSITQLKQYNLLRVRRSLLKKYFTERNLTFES